MTERDIKTLKERQREREEQKLENSKLTCKLCGSVERETFLFFILDILGVCVGKSSWEGGTVLSITVPVPVPISVSVSV